MLDNLKEAIEERTDFFIVEDNIRFAGRHLLIDIKGAKYLDDIKKIEENLIAAAKVADATVLYSYFHHFQVNSGVSGVVVLAESHISIHTWPEEKYAAIDVFMCGDSKPYKSAELIKNLFEVEEIKVDEYKRGRSLLC